MIFGKLQLPFGNIITKQKKICALSYNNFAQKESNAQWCVAYSSEMIVSFTLTANIKYNKSEPGITQAHFKFSTFPSFPTPPLLVLYQSTYFKVFVFKRRAREPSNRSSPVFILFRIISTTLPLKSQNEHISTYTAILEYSF